MKDFFSSQSKVYAAFRPTYPKELYEFIFRHVPEKKIAWDCATGNGQVAQFLSHHFEKVYATDISQQQLDHAVPENNIFYSKSQAEKTSFRDNEFDLITVAQALHWFDRDLFYEEGRRVSKPNAVLAVWGYGLLSIEPVIDGLIMEFYNEKVGPYWDEARRLVEDEYRTITFPFDEVKAPAFSIKVDWTLDQLSGYFSSWSATQKYIRQQGNDPVPPVMNELQKYWNKPTMEVTFPIFLRLGKIEK
ncbi:MAG TPA: class I SAM-dependent methyltransferase [Chryseolinea sp.]|nr:class I SAM-dependent methyltransferase [Chryseolinea sp.]